MGRQFISGSSQYLSNATAVLTAWPMTVSLWCYPVALANNAYFLSIGGDTFTGTVRLGMNATGTVLLGTVDNGNTSATVTTTNTMVAGNWYHLCGVVVGNASRSVYINGGSKTTSTTSLSVASSMTHTVINGRWNSSSIVNNTSAVLAHCAVWSVALTDAEVVQLAQGAWPPSIRPQSLAAYWPLSTPGVVVEYDASPCTPRRYDLTATNSPLPSIDPPVIVPFRRARRPAASAAASTGAPIFSGGIFGSRLIQPGGGGLVA